MTPRPISSAATALKLATVVSGAVALALTAAVTARADATQSVSFGGHVRGEGG
jgi:hypothetical protein